MISLKWNTDTIRNPNKKDEKRHRKIFAKGTWDPGDDYWDKVGLAVGPMLAAELLLFPALVCRKERLKLI